MSKRGCPIKDISGSRFGKLVAIKATDKRKNLNVVWECLCDCGKICEVRQGQLQSGGRKSCGCLVRLEKGESSFNHLLDHYKRGAKQRGHSFLLTKEEFKDLTSSPCFYCGSPPAMIKTSPNYFGEYIYNGIDRVKNNLGYEKSNCVSCCKFCNRAKSDFSYEEFIKWINIIIKFRTKENELWQIPKKVQLNIIAELEHHS